MTSLQFDVLLTQQVKVLLELGRLVCTVSSLVSFNKNQRKDKINSLEEAAILVATLPRPLSTFERRSKVKMNGCGLIFVP